jgi:hypothetical protein
LEIKILKTGFYYLNTIKKKVFLIITTLFYFEKEGKVLASGIVQFGGDGGSSPP